VLGSNGTVLTDITPRAGPETVYNFEVAGEHVYYVGSDGLLVHNAVYLGKIVSSKTGKGIQKATQPHKLKKSARRLKNGSTPSNISGKRAHAKYNPGKNYNKKYQLPSGRRPDAIDLKKRIVRELKPYNQRNVARGTKQLEGYITELESTLGGKWTGILDFWK
jgi:hypothetical protein